MDSVRKWWHLGIATMNGMDQTTKVMAKVMATRSRSVVTLIPTKVRFYNRKVLATF